MDIIIHSLSGMAVGTSGALLVGKNTRDRLALVALCTFAGAFPDIDAISLWSGFDGTIGKFFGLEHSGGEIYSAKFWYSHHAFTHSLICSILFAALSSIRPIIKRNKKRTMKVFLLVLLAYNAHLFGDMPTPTGPWGGISYFFPLDIYIGGSGKIWWWNNYDIFLILLMLNLFNLLLIFVYYLRKNKSLRFVPVILFFIGLGWSVRQINHRDLGFNHQDRRGKYLSFEKKSLEIQREILGDFLYERINKFDNSINLYF